MKAKLLEVGAADGRVREILLSEEEFLIGRGEDCSLCLHEPDISRHHCLIRTRGAFGGAKPIISDLGSSNGTYINGHRLLSQTPIATGDEIRIGPFRYVVDLGDNPDFQLPELLATDPLAATRTLKDAKPK